MSKYMEKQSDLLKLVPNNELKILQSTDDEVKV
jgi:hypothetical protein